jgi:hypothetical protein
MQWSYDCTGYNNANQATASDDSFSININSSGDDIGPDDSGDVTDSGTEYYTDTGQVQLSTITTGCDWTIKVTQP